MSNPVRIVALVVVVAAVGFGAYTYLGKNAADDGPANLVIQLGNNSYDTLTGLEVSPASAGTYTKVDLTGGELTAGSFYELVLPGGAAQCKYDLRFAKADGKSYDRNGVDLCAATFYHFEDQ